MVAVVTVRYRSTILHAQLSGAPVSAESKQDCQFLFGAGFGWHGERHSIFPFYLVGFLRAYRWAHRDVWI